MWRLIAWAIYTVGCFLVMLIGFTWQVSMPVSIIVGFVCQLLNEIIQIELKKHPELGQDPPNWNGLGEFITPEQTKKDKKKVSSLKFTPPDPKSARFISLKSRHIIKSDELTDGYIPTIDNTDTNPPS